jgi:hypothetical protein
VLAARAASAARGEGEDGDPNQRAIRENELMRPVLAGKQANLKAQAQALLASKKSDPETIKEFQQLEADYWQLEIQKGTLAAGAARAEKALQKKAGEEATKAFRARTQIARDQAAAKAAEALPGQEQRALLRELGPVLQEEQNALLADLANYKEGSADYWKAVGEIEKSKREQAKLEQNAAKEAANQQKKTAEEHRKASRERLQLMGAEIRLAELQLKNNPLLSERQRRAAANQLLARQYAEALQPQAGENRMERVNRLLEAEQIKGQVLDNFKAMGYGRLGQVYAVRQLDALARQAAGSGLAAQQQQLAEAQRAAKAAEAQHGGTFIGQVIITDPTPAKLVTAFDQLQRQRNRDSGIVTPAGGYGRR